MLRLLLFTTILLFPVLSRAGDKDKKTGKSLHVTMGTSGKISQINDINNSNRDTIAITINGINSLKYKRLDTSKLDRPRLLRDSLAVFRSIPFTSFDTSINTYSYPFSDDSLIRVVNNESGAYTFSTGDDTSSYRYITPFDDVIDITISKANVQNRVYRQYYNAYPHIANIVDTIDYLMKLEERIWAFKDLTSEYFLIDQCNQIDYGTIRDEFLSLTRDIDSIVSNDRIMNHIHGWMHRWVAITKSWTTNPLGMTDVKDLSAFKDTTILKDEITRLEKLMGNMDSYDKHFHYLKQKLNLQKSHLDKIRFYARAIETSDRIKAGFYEYENIAAIDFKTGYNYSRIHDASNDFALVNKTAAERHEYDNDDKVAVLTYNIPHAAKFNLEYVSKGYVAELQATRFFNTVANSISTQVVAYARKMASDYEDYSYPQVWNSRCEYYASLQKFYDSVHKLHNLIAPLTANLPPSAGIAFADDKDGGYKMEAKIIESKDNDSSYKHTYTFESGEPGDKQYKKKETTIEFHQKKRFQFVSGAHFFTGSAPIVEKKDGAYILTSSNTIRYSVGIKTYFAKQTFSDINFKNTTLLDYVGYRLIGSSHFILSADVQKPLENIYAGYGVDIVPGLGVNCGIHLYKYRKYQLHNGVEVGYSDAYKLRNGVYIAATMDGSVLSKIFLSIFK